MQRFPQRVTIFGVGLIGGSLALALKRAFPEIQIAGVDKPDVLERARRLRIIDRVLGSDHNVPASVESDLIILATPIGDIMRFLYQFTRNNRVLFDPRS